MKRIVGLLMVALFACAGAYAQTKNYLKMPDNIRETVEYNDSLNVYYIGQKMGEGLKKAGSEIEGFVKGLFSKD